MLPKIDQKEYKNKYINSIELIFKDLKVENINHLLL